MSIKKLAYAKKICFDTYFVLAYTNKQGGLPMIRYYKLFDLLNRRGLKKTDLLDIVSSPTLAKISKGKNIQTDVIDKICKALDCQPGDIMEYVPEEDVLGNFVEMLNDEDLTLKEKSKLAFKMGKDFGHK